ncbi:HipA N-terminal domain-containing protein, partial [uncultured Flavobacterium sp.]
MRQAEVYYKDTLAGIIIENDDGYIFQYDESYLRNANSKPVSLTLP